MPERLAVIQVKGHHRHIDTHRGHGGIAKARSLEGLNPGLLKPLHIGPMPHHTGVIGVLREHTLGQGVHDPRNAVTSASLHGGNHP